MHSISKGILCCICTFFFQVTYACEPVSLDWKKLYQDYDQNHDQMIDQNEWKKLIELNDQFVAWEKTSITDPKRLKIFKALDQNHNGLIDQQEMTNIYLYFANPCKGWGSKWDISKN